MRTTLHLRPRPILNSSKTKAWWVDSRTLMSILIGATIPYEFTQPLWNLHTTFVAQNSTLIASWLERGPPI